MYAPKQSLRLSGVEHSCCRDSPSEKMSPTDPHAKPRNQPIRAARASAVVSAQESAELGADPDDLARVRTALGQTIKELRQARGLTTRKLASTIGVSPGFISQIENTQAMPSVPTLLSLADAFGLLIGDLFHAPIGTRQVVRRHERPAFDYPSLGLRDELLSSDPTGKLEVLIGYVEPGKGSGNELYTHGADTEFVLVLEGKLQVFLGADSHILEESDCVTFAGDIPHGYVNPGDTTARVIWVYTPASY